MAGVIVKVLSEHNKTPVMKLTDNELSGSCINIASVVTFDAFSGGFYLLFRGPDPDEKAANVFSVQLHSRNDRAPLTCDPCF